MDNANSPEYLGKIKNAIIENLSRTKFAPSVQMQDTPRDIPGLNDVDEQDDELDDIDEDESRDVRKSQRARDKAIARDDEFSDSEDDEENAGLGLSRQPGVQRRRNMMDYQNADAVADDQPLHGSPAPPQQLDVGRPQRDEEAQQGKDDAGSDVSRAPGDDDVNMDDGDESTLAARRHEGGQVDLSEGLREDVEMGEAEKDEGRAERVEEDEKGEARAEAAT